MPVQQETQILLVLIIPCCAGSCNWKFFQGFLQGKTTEKPGRDGHQRGLHTKSRLRINIKRL